MSRGSRYTEGQIVKVRREIEAACIQPGSPWQNGHVESFFDKLRDELLQRELFDSGAELQTHLDEHMEFYNHQRPHRSLRGLAPSSFRDRTSSTIQEAEELKL